MADKDRLREDAAMGAVAIRKMLEGQILELMLDHRQRTGEEIIAALQKRAEDPDLWFSLTFEDEQVGEALAQLIAEGHIRRKDDAFGA